MPLLTAATSLVLDTAKAPPDASHLVSGLDRADQLTGWAFFAVSETLTFFPKIKSNGVIQLLLSIAIRAFPYEPPRRRPEPMTLERFLRGLRNRRRR